MLGIKYLFIGHFINLWIVVFFNVNLDRIATQKRHKTSEFKLETNQLINTGHLQKGSEAFMVAVLIRYSGGNGQSYNSMSINSTGVFGLKAELAPGKLSVGDGTLIFNITGKPKENGLASFKGVFFNQKLQFNRIVDPILCR